MRLHRGDAGELARMQAAQTAKASAEEVLHPPGSTPRFTTPARLQQAWDDDEIVAFPDNPRVTGLRRDPRMGELAGRLGQKPSLYEGLRPEALATALYIGAQVRAMAGDDAPLTVTSTVRDETYQRRLVSRNREATRNYSLHTTGWAFDLARRYRLAAPGAGLPVRPRPPADARRDRLGARARRDPRDGRAGGGGPASVARTSTTLGMTDAIRTPDQILEGLPDFPYAPHYRTVDGLRLAHVDEGDGAPVVMWHGEPTWGFLWRHLLPPVRDAGHRVVLPDLVGFGRSDKPMERSWYSYDRHVEMAATLLEDLDLRDATFVVHDWGGPIGLRLAVEHPERVKRLVILDSGVFTGASPMNDAWQAFAAFVERTEDLPVGFLVRRGCHRDPGDEVAAAYDAPFPSIASKAGARAFPGLIPQQPDAPGAAEGRRVLEALRGDERPTLMLWAADDPVLPPKLGEAFAGALGQPSPRVIPEAGHYLQEDQGPLIGAAIADWLGSQR